MKSFLAASLYCYRNCTLRRITCLKTFIHTWMAASLVLLCTFFLALKVFWAHVARNLCFVSTWQSLLHTIDTCLRIALLPAFLLALVPACKFFLAVCLTLHILSGDVTWNTFLPVSTRQSFLDF